MALLGGAIYFLYIKSAVNSNFGQVTIGNKVFKVEVAGTPYKREQGLSNRNSIGSDGMLFVFDTPARYSFWMKDMKFALDIVWFRDNRIVSMDAHIQPPQSGETLKSFSPPAEVNYVLELPEGSIQKYGIDQGNRVQISLPEQKL